MRYLTEYSSSKKFDSPSPNDDDDDIMLYIEYWWPTLRSGGSSADPRLWCEWRCSVVRNCLLCYHDDQDQSTHVHRLRRNSSHWGH